MVDIGHRAEQHGNYFNQTARILAAFLILCNIVEMKNIGVAMAIVLKHGR